MKIGTEAGKRGIGCISLQLKVFAYRLITLTMKYDRVKNNDASIWNDVHDINCIIAEHTERISLHSSSNDCDVK